MVGGEWVTIDRDGSVIEGMVLGLVEEDCIVFGVDEGVCGRGWQGGVWWCEDVFSAIEG
jgi:hypothetical protein